MEDAIRVEVSERAIDVVALHSEMPDSGHGAQVLFLGVVRAQNHGRQVEAVSYDAFVPLTERILRQICEEAQNGSEWPLRFRVVHRIGKLQVGEASVAILVGTRHRDQAYVSSRYVIEELKRRAAIWKKEHYSDGESEWLRGHALCSHS